MPIPDELVEVFIVRLLNIPPELLEPPFICACNAAESARMAKSIARESFNARLMGFLLVFLERFDDM